MQIYDHLEHLLLANSQTMLRGGKDKDSLKSKQKHPSIHAIKNFPFIEFNSHKMVSFMILDLDWYQKPKYQYSDQHNKKLLSKQGITIREHFGNCMEMFKLMLEDLDIPYAWICETQKGYQIGFHFESKIFLNNEKQKYRLKSIRTHLTQTINNELKCEPGAGIDLIASNRYYGIFRNPLLHKHIYNDDYGLTFKDFEHMERQLCEIIQDDIHLVISPQGHSNTHQPTNPDVKSLHARFLNQDKNLKVDEGQRKTFLFHVGMFHFKHHQKLSQPTISKLLSIINQEHIIQPLPIEEIEDLSKSIHKYWKQKTIFITDPRKTSANQPKKSKKDQEWYQTNKDKRQEQMKDYYHTNKSAILEYKKSYYQKNKHHILKKKSPSDSSSTQKPTTQEIILTEIDNFHQSHPNQKLNISQIARETGFSRDTVYKYLSQCSSTII